MKTALFNYFDIDIISRLTGLPNCRVGIASNIAKITLGRALIFILGLQFVELKFEATHIMFQFRDTPKEYIGGDGRINWKSKHALKSGL
jgi:hypothetical protein